MNMHPALSFALLLTMPGALSAQVFDLPDPPLDVVRGMHFFSADTGVVCGNAGIMRTTDAGSSWVEVDDTPYLPFDMAFSHDGVHGICGMNNGTVLITHDKGVTWTSSTVLAGATIMHVGVANGQHFFVDFVSEDARYTLDGGASWQAFTATTNFQAMHFTNDNEGHCLTISSIWRTTDGGVSWDLLTDEFPELMRNVHFTDPLHGWVSGDDGYIAATTDGGVTWNTQYTNNLYDRVNDVQMHPSGLGIAGVSRGDLGPVLFTLNSGAAWTAIAVLDANVYAISIATANMAYMCDNNGDLKRVTIPTGMEELTAHPLQVAPVPAMDRVVVHWPHANGHPWWLELLDMTGRLIAVHQSKGDQVVLERNGLAGGSYLLRARGSDGLGATVQKIVFESAN